MKTPSSKIIGILAVGAVVLAVLFAARSCDIYDELSELKGKHEALQVEYADLDLAMRADLEAYRADIAARDAAIAEAQGRIEAVEGRVKAKDADLLRLEEEFTQLGEDKDAKIINLQAQVDIWKEKFNLAQRVIAEKDNIIFDLTAKYDAQVKISGEWETAYDRQVELHSVALERIDLMEGELKKARVGSRLKTYVVGGLAAAFVYSMAKK